LILDFIRLGALDRSLRKAQSQALGKRLQAQPDTFVRYKFGRCVVHQETVFDTLHASRDGSPDRSRSKGMGDDIGAPIVGRFDRGAQFGLGEGGHVDRTEGRRYATARRQLDLRGAQHELFACAHAHLVGAVRNHGAADQLHAGEHAADRPRQIGQLSEVPVPAGDRDHGAGWIDARSPDDAFIDGALETEHRTAHVANGGKAAHQRVGRLVTGREIVVSDVTERIGWRRTREHRVPVIVDQAGHQRPATPIYDRGGRASIDWNGRRGNSFDQVAANQYIGWF
jgi:hypothetical protein